MTSKNECTWYTAAGRRKHMGPIEKSKSYGRIYHLDIMKQSDIMVFTGSESYLIGARYAARSQPFKAKGWCFKTKIDRIDGTMTVTRIK